MNATLIGQTIAMAVFVWFTMKFIWPKVMAALEERREKIAEGLAASDRAENELAEAREKADQILKDARAQASEIIDQATNRGNQIVEEAKQDATEERKRQAAAAEAEIRHSLSNAREQLRSEVASLTLLGAERIVGKEIDANAHEKLLDELAQEV